MSGCRPCALCFGDCLISNIHPCAECGKASLGEIMLHSWSGAGGSGTQTSGASSHTCQELVGQMPISDNYRRDETKPNKKKKGERQLGEGGGGVPDSMPLPACWTTLLPFL